MRRLLSVILTPFIFFVFFSLTPMALAEPTPEAPSGSGTGGDPYRIANIANLYWLTQNSGEWDKYYIQTADIDASDTATWNGNAGFSPIGNGATPFSGSYDGQGSVITGLTIDRSGTDNVGLFGYVNNGAVKNLGVTGANITGRNYVGAVAGYLDGSSTMSCCFSSGSVTGNWYLGGLIGANAATLRNSGSVASVNGSFLVGGAAGTNGGTMTNCYAAGLVTAGSNGGGLTGAGAATNSFWDTETSGQAASGGGTGKTTAEMTDIATFTDTSTVGLTTAWDFVGTPNDDAGTDDWWNMNLIAAKTDNSGYPVPSWWAVTDEPSGSGASGDPYLIATLNNLYWLSEGGGTSVWNTGSYFQQTADIPAKSTAYIHSGRGFSPIGSDAARFSGSYDGQNHEIDQLFINRTSDYFVGLFGYVEDVTFEDLGIAEGNVTGLSSTGMLVGYGDVTDAATITHCYASGQVVGVDIENGAKTGGLIGEYHVLDGETLTLSRDHFSGTVSGSGNVGTGGLAGYLGDASNHGGTANIDQCYSTADVTQTWGVGYVGGLIGRLDCNATVQKCYSTGEITFNSNFYSSTRVGGLIGDCFTNGSTIKNCYSRCNLNNSSNEGYAGGLLGSGSPVTFQNSYSAGKVPVCDEYGGFVGFSNSLLGSTGTPCFWDTQTSGQNVGVGYPSPDPDWLTGENTADMKTQSTFTNWDFTTIWAIDPAKNDGYPYLRETATKVHLSGPANVAPGAVSGAFTLESQSDTDVATDVEGDTVFDLSSNSSGTATFYSDAAGTIEITQLTIAAGTSQSTFYYQDTQSGAPTVTAAYDSGPVDLGSDTHQITVLATYTVTYDANGATSGTAPDDQTKVYDVSLTLQTNTGGLAKTGYGFNGWNTADDGSGDHYDAGGAYTANAAVTLFAEWTGDGYTVTFDKQGGTGGSDSVSATYGSPMPAATAPTRAGYTFGGYYTGTGGSGTQYYTAAMASARNWDLAANTTLYAQWTGDGYTVTFDKQGGTGGSDNVSATYGSAMPAATAPTRAGYTFGGYYTGTGGSGTQYYTAAMASARNWDLAANTTLYAQWTGDGYTVTFDKQGGTGGSDNVSATYGSAMPAATAPTREGYTFGGYYTGTGGSGTQYYTAAMESARNWDLAAEITLFAQWTGDGYTVTFDKQGGTGGSDNVSATYGSPMPAATAPTREGYTFGGYYTGTGGSGTQYYTAAMASAQNWDLAEETTLYAEWTVDEYFVTFDANGGTDPEPDGKWVTYGEPYGALAATTREGYFFTGWFTAATGGTRVTSDTIVSTAEDHTLYAQWSTEPYPAAPVSAIMLLLLQD